MALSKKEKTSRKPLGDGALRREKTNQTPIDEEVYMEVSASVMPPKQIVTIPAHAVQFGSMKAEKADPSLALMPM